MVLNARAWDNRELSTSDIEADEVWLQAQANTLLIKCNIDWIQLFHSNTTLFFIFWKRKTDEIVYVTLINNKKKKSRFVVYTLI